MLFRSFTGDAVIDVVDREPRVREANLLIMEVTFLGDDVSPQKARARGHIHLEDVVARAELFRNTHILFTHFSARYSATQVHEILAAKLPDSMKGRVTTLV